MSQIDRLFSMCKSQMFSPYFHKYLYICNGLNLWRIRQTNLQSDRRCRSWTSIVKFSMWFSDKCLVDPQFVRCFDDFPIEPDCKSKTKQLVKSMCTSKNQTTYVEIEHERIVVFDHRIICESDSNRLVHLCDVKRFVVKKNCEHFTNVAFLFSQFKWSLTTEFTISSLLFKMLQNSERTCLFSSFSTSGFIKSSILSLVSRVIWILSLSNEQSEKDTSNCLSFVAPERWNDIVKRDVAMIGSHRI